MLCYAQQKGEKGNWIRVLWNFLRRQTPDSQDGCCYSEFAGLNFLFETLNIQKYLNQNATFP